MSFEEDLIALVLPLFPTGRAWFDTMPDGMSAAERSSAEFCLIQQVGGEDRWYFDNTPYDFSNARMQFTVWGPRRIEVMNKMRELRKAIADANSPTLITMPQGAGVSDYNEVLKLRGVHQNFGFWYPDPLAV